MYVDKLLFHQKKPFKQEIKVRNGTGTLSLIPLAALFALNWS